MQNLELVMENQISPRRTIRECISAKLFETTLFRNGRLQVPMNMAEETCVRWYMNDKSWLEGNWSLTELQRNTAIADARDRRWYELDWIRQFNGHVPADWNPYVSGWIQVANAFERAGKFHLQLDPMLVAAGITFPHERAPLTCGQKQRLTAEQMALLANNPLPRQEEVRKIWQLQEEIFHIGPEEILRAYDLRDSWLPPPSYDKYVLLP